MILKSIVLHHLAIPFNTPIQHNLKSRNCSESIIVVITDEKGNIGYGEGAPRSYVTNEHVEEILTHSQSILSKCIDHAFDSIDDIDNFCHALTIWLNFPSLVTAIEIALLDLWGRKTAQAMATLLSISKPRAVSYSAVLPMLPKEQLKKWLAIVKQGQFKHLKVKVGLEGDVENLALIRAFLGETIDIRVDANRAWHFEEAVDKINQLVPFNIAGVEEPLISEAVNFLPQLAREIDVPVILDESIYTLEHARFFQQHIAAERVIFNLKLSKCGGLLTTAKLHHFATQHGIQCQLGCNVGESAILSAAGRHFASIHELKYVEGCYGNYFMADDISTSPIEFQDKGVGYPLTAAGLGIPISPNKLEQYSVSKKIMEKQQSRSSTFSAFSGKHC